MEKPVLKWNPLVGIAEVFEPVWVQVEVMAQADGWAMCRRKGRKPEVFRSDKLWDEPTDDTRREYYE